MVILFAEKCVASTHAVPQSCKQRETAGAVSNAFENLTAVVEPDVLAFARILPFSIRGKAEFCTRKEKSMEIRARPETVLFYLYKS